MRSGPSVVVALVLVGVLAASVAAGALQGEAPGATLADGSGGSLGAADDQNSRTPSPGRPSSRDGSDAAVPRVRRARAEHPPEDPTGAPGDVEPASSDLVSGVVRMPDGTPVAGAFVALGDLDRACDTTLTAADGRFGFEDWASYATVNAVALRDGAVWRGRVPADGPAQNLTVTLSPAPPGEGAVFVHVTGPSGAEVPRACVQQVAGPFRVTDLGPRRIGDWADRTTVAAGWFAIPERRLREDARDAEAASAYLVSEPSDADGRALPWGPALVTIPPGASGVLEVRLPRGESLSGRVVLPDGRPAAGARMLLVPPPPSGFDPRSMMTPPRVARTDGAGRFEFTDLAPGSGTLSVLPGVVRVDFTDGTHGVTSDVLFGDAHTGAAPCEIRTGAGDVVVTLRRPVRTEIVAADGLGRVVEGAALHVRGAEDWVAADGVSDRAGSCDFPALPEGAVLEVTVVPADLADGLAATRTRPVAVDGTVRIVLPPEVPLRGRVVAPDGTSLPQVPVTVERADGIPAAAVSGNPFVVRGLAAGTRAALSIHDSDGRRVAGVEATAGDDVLLRWPDEDDRLTLVLPVQRPEFDVVLRSHGRAECSVRPTGPVVTFPSGQLPERVDVQVGPTPDGEFAWLPQHPARGFHRVDLRSGETLRGRLIVEGTDVPGIQEFTATATGEFEGFSHGFKTIWDGTFEVRGLPPGRVAVEATLRDGRRVRADVELPAAEDLVLRVHGD